MPNMISCVWKAKNCTLRMCLWCGTLFPSTYKAHRRCIECDRREDAKAKITIPTPEKLLKDEVNKYFSEELVRKWSLRQATKRERNLERAQRRGW